MSNSSQETVCTCGLGPARPEDHATHCAAFRTSKTVADRMLAQAPDNNALQEAYALIERLQRERDQAVETVAREGRHARRVEIERLRTALEQIANLEIRAGFRLILTHNDIARRALAGNAPETSAGVTPCS